MEVWTHQFRNAVPKCAIMTLKLHHTYVQLYTQL